MEADDARAMTIEAGLLLQRANDVGAACRAAVGLLAGRDLLPSAYLARGGRLRCMALEGYWQVRDGMPPGAGVIGRTYRLGEETLRQDVAACGEYLEAAHGVVAEIGVPLRIAGTVAGVLNVEARRPFRDADLELIRAVAGLLADRIHELGGPPAESLGQRLARHAVRLTGVHDVHEVEREALAAALDVTPLSSALFLRVHRSGAVEPRAALGPLDRVLLGASRDALAAVAQFVATGTSCYTVGRPDDDMASGMASLRSAGAESVAAFGAPVEDGIAVIVLADHEPVALASEEVELMELLAAHAAACLATALAVGELRDRAATDPLTGLGHHATFHAALAAGHSRRDVALLLCDIDGFKALNDSRGHQAGDRLLVRIAACLSGAVRRGDAVFRVGGDEFAALVRVADAGEAAEAGARLRSAVEDAALGVTLSIGVAVPEAGESEAELLARADRALYAVKGAGRNGVALAPPRRASRSRSPVGA